MSSSEFEHVPHWHHQHRAESRLIVNVVVVLVILLQVSLPRSLNSSFPWFVCGIEAALLLALNFLDPKRASAHAGWPRIVSIILIATMTIANSSSVVRLVDALLSGGVKDAKSLLLTGGSIWLTNVVIFSLWYWGFDRGGPGARSQAIVSTPDFMFPQMSDPDLAPLHWSSSFFDYLYMSFTNSSAFSPTDVLPLTRWAKATMLLQSLTSLLVVVLVIARAVNILH